MKAIALLGLLACAAHAQGTIPERTLGEPTVVGIEGFRNIAAIRELSDGRLIVVEHGPANAMLQNMIAGMARAAGRGGRGGRGAVADSTTPAPRRRVARVVMFDRSLANATPIGQAGEGPGEYMQPDGLVSGLMDTTVLLDLGRSDLLVIDPTGKIVTPKASPTRAGALLVLSGVAVDRNGRLLYQPRQQISRNTPIGMEIVTPDTAPIMAYDFKTSGTIPIAQVHVEGSTSTMESDTTNPGGMHMRMQSFPFPTIDDWVMMPDGTIAIIRGADLHIDWLAPNGKWRSTPPIPYAKMAVTDSDKVQLRARLSGSSAMMDSMPMMPRNLSMTQIEPDSFPAFKPPFSARGAKAASDGTIWLPAKVISPLSPDGFYVVGPNGRIREHVHLLKGQRLLGFGKGVVYVAVNEGPQNNRVARVALR